MENFQKRLREERKRLGLKGAELACVGGVSGVSQSNYENGKKIPGAGYLAAIAAAGVDVQYVLTGRRSSEPVLTPEEKAVLAAWKNASKEVQAAALAALLAGADAQKPARQIVGGNVHTEPGGKTIIAKNIGNLKM